MCQCVEPRFTQQIGRIKSYNSYSLYTFADTCTVRHVITYKVTKGTTAWLEYLVIGLTGAVGVDREALVDVVLDEQKSLLEDLPGTGLLHCVGVTWVPEKSQQLSWSTRLTGGMRDREMVDGSRERTKE